MEAPRARAEGTGGAATTQAFEYPVQRHAGSRSPFRFRERAEESRGRPRTQLQGRWWVRGQSPWHEGTAPLFSLMDRLSCEQDIIKGKLTNNAELIENGRMRQTGELRERERAREKQEEADVSRSMLYLSSLIGAALLQDCSCREDARPSRNSKQGEGPRFAFDKAVKSLYSIVHVDTLAIHPSPLCPLPWRLP